MTNDGGNSEGISVYVLEAIFKGKYKGQEVRNKNINYKKYINI